MSQQDLNPSRSYRPQGEHQPYQQPQQIIPPGGSLGAGGMYANGSVNSAPSSNMSGMPTPPVNGSQQQQLSGLRTTTAWQPTAAGTQGGRGPPLHMPQQQQQQQQQHHIPHHQYHAQQQQQQHHPTHHQYAYPPQQRPPYGAGAPYYNPYQPYNPAAVPRYGGAPVAYSQPPYSNMRGGVFYPPPQMTQTPQGGTNGINNTNVPLHATGMAATNAAGKGGVPKPIVVPPKPRKPLTITDKNGNVIEIDAAPSQKSSVTSATTTATPTSTRTVTPEPSTRTSTPTSAATASTATNNNVTPELNAGAKLRQAALERLMGSSSKTSINVATEDTAKKEEEEKAKKEAEEAKQVADEKAKNEAEEKARSEAEGKAKKEAEAKAEAEENAKKEAEEKAKKEAEEEARIEDDEKQLKLAEEKVKEVEQIMSVSSNDLSSSMDTKSTLGRRVYSKQLLLELKEQSNCETKPDSLPDMTITKGMSRGKSGGGQAAGGNRSTNQRNNNDSGGEWTRGYNPQRRQSSHGDNIGGGGGGRGGGGQWTRGQAPPEKVPQRQRSRGGRGGGQQHQQYDSSYTPIVKSANHWRPQKNTSAFVVVEKQVKSILNKMTKEKFDKLSQQMLEIPIQSHDILKMMINNVYDKAIDEPSFGELYADLCVRLSTKEFEFIKIIESDEEPPTEGDAGDSTNDDRISHHTVYRWSSDVGTSDSEIMGPFSSIEECYDLALDEGDNDPKPVERGDMSLELVEVSIRHGIFVKIMKKVTSGKEDVYYTVYFPTSEAEECGQQLSDIFLSQLECVSDANKKNSFKRSLLNKCEDEFVKTDIYIDWKKEKKEYDEKKSSMTEAERAEKEEELSFRRIRIKKQMLGNVKFIAQLFKKRLLREKIMRYCIGDLLKLKTDEPKAKQPTYYDTGDKDIDDEDHEAICNMFSTLGSTIDHPAAADFMRLCFTKIEQLSKDKSLSSRARFMYKDLLDLRANNWVPRRKEEKMKTLEEIRQEVEREEIIHAQQSAAAASSAGNNPRGSFVKNDYRGRQPSFVNSSNRLRPSKPITETDEDGFTKIGKPATAAAPSFSRPSPTKGSSVSRSSQNISASTEKSGQSNKNSPAALSPEKLKKRIAGIITDYINSGDNESELVLSFDELSGTPEAGKTLVSQYADKIIECKQNERRAIISIVSTLFEKNKLTANEIKEGLMDAIEFIDSTVVDAPRAYEYLADLMAPLMVKKAFDTKWLCEQLEKTKVAPDCAAPERLVSALGTSLKKLLGDSAVSAYLSSSDPRLQSLLGDKLNDTMKSI